MGLHDRLDNVPGLAVVAVMRSSVQVERDGMREGTHEQTGILISLDRKSVV